jgi:hypothetical protein
MTKTEVRLGCLCCWLINQKNNKMKANQNFNKFHQAIEPELRKQIMNKIRIDDVDEVKSKVFSKFTSFICKRPDASNKILKLAPTLNLPSRGNDFDEKSKQWGQDMAAWVNETMAFCSQFDEQSTLDGCEQNAKEINNCLVLLGTCGVDLLDWVEWNKFSQASAQTSSKKNSCCNDEAKKNTDESTQEKNYDKKLKSFSKHVKFIKNIIKQSNCESEGYKVADALLGTSGGSRFVIDCVEILEQSKYVKIPLPHLIFTIAKNEIADYYKNYKGSVERSMDSGKANEDDKTFSIDNLSEHSEEIKQREEEQNVLREYEEMIYPEYINSMLFLPLKEASDKCISVKKQLELSTLTEKQKGLLTKEIYDLEKIVSREHLRYKFNKKLLNFLWEEPNVNIAELARKMDVSRDVLKDKYIPELGELLSPMYPQELRKKRIKKLLNYLNGIKVEFGNELPELPNKLDDTEWIPVLQQVQLLLNEAIEKEKSSQIISCQQQEHWIQFFLELWSFDETSTKSKEEKRDNIINFYNSSSELVEHEIIKQSGVSLDTVRSLKNKYQFAVDKKKHSEKEIKKMKKRCKDIELTLDAFQKDGGYYK